MSNPRNNGQITGRVGCDPQVFENRDGSKKVWFTVFADRAYTNAQNQRESDGIPVEAFVRADTQGLGPFAHIHKGDLITVSYTLRMEHYTKNGQDHRTLKVVYEGMAFLESRSVTEERMRKRVKAAEEQALQARAAARDFAA
ncbi:single-stranded DNA-binding protein [Streptomyces sp. NRRL F-5053]|uniref:single-stranded DNA-binding protein n=1 Tax=Streptomyces sp. NRRL F-5053 TaxID=1463854 RepID=UPI0004C62C8F|nr:single-stranded DNA-binding protein [Streptomyces sp. NRRL F-5053]